MEKKGAPVLLPLRVQRRTLTGLETSRGQDVLDPRLRDPCSVPILPLDLQTVEGRGSRQRLLALVAAEPLAVVPAQMIRRPSRVDTTSVLVSLAESTLALSGLQELRYEQMGAKTDEKVTSTMLRLVCTIQSLKRPMMTPSTRRMR